MYQINHCPSCNSDNIEYKQTLLAKFVASRISGTLVDNDMPIIGIKCHNCNFVGSAHRFTQQEQEKLYNGYRDSEYTRMRIICEPGYQKIAEFGFDSEYREQRQTGIKKLIKQHINIDQIHTVLDYGGDTGSMIPDNFIKSEKYVFDINVVIPMDGVKVYNPNEGKSFDFIMCTHVLEHQSDIDDLLTNIKLCAHNDTWFYFEMPNNPKPYIGIFHEHINFFNIQSLTALLDRNRFAPVDYCEYGYDDEVSAHANNLCILAKLKK